MTTNHIERLDTALIRPDRVDMRVEFHPADEDIISQLFFFVYKSPSIDEEKPGKGVDRTGTDNIGKDCNLSRLAQEFVAKMPKLKYSSAEIMSVLLENKQSPSEAIASVERWTERIREERHKFTRTDSCALDDGGSSDH